MAVSLMVPEKEILAVGGIYILPIFKRKFDGRKRGMRMKLISEAMLFKEGNDLGYACVFSFFHYLLSGFAKFVGSAFFF
jgi:hypothetical protein